MSPFNITTKRCPVCEAQAVERVSGREGSGEPQYHCLKCHAELDIVPTFSMLWAIPVAALALLAVIPLAIWIFHTRSLNGPFRSALGIGIAMMVAPIVIAVAQRGLVFRRRQP
jgi:hypothetical protein